MFIGPSLEDHIRQLCEQAVHAEDSQVEEILGQLRFALREDVRFTRELAAAAVHWDGARNSSSRKSK